MTAAPRVSIILPTYRCQEHVRASLPQLLRQTERDIEIVVVDDGSADGTAETAQSAAGGDPRVRVIALAENGGVARARRHAVDESRGEFLWFVDADDDWPDDAVEVLLAQVRPDVDVVVAGARFRYRDGSSRPLRAPDSPPVSGAEALRMLLSGRISGHLWNKLFRRETMARASFAPARVQSDLAMTADALSYAGTVAFVPTPVYDYRLRDGSLITATAQRAESLALIDASVTAAAQRAGLASTADHRYFRARYVQLSAIKDALLADYPTATREDLLRRRRRSLTWRDVAMLARRRDVRRFVLGATAKTSLRLHRAVLNLADR